MSEPTSSRWYETAITQPGRVDQEARTQPMRAVRTADETDMTTPLSIDDLMDPSPPAAPAPAAPAPAAPAPAAPSAYADAYPAEPGTPVAGATTSSAAAEPARSKPDHAGQPDLRRRMADDARAAARDAGQWAQEMLRAGSSWLRTGDNGLITATALVALLLLVTILAW